VEKIPDKRIGAVLAPIFQACRSADRIISP
jgi:hypothetical protein